MTVYHVKVMCFPSSDPELLEARLEITADYGPVQHKKILVNTLSDALLFSAAVALSEGTRGMREQAKPPFEIDEAPF